MQGKSGVKCFLFCLIVAICVAVPLSDINSSHGDTFKLTVKSEGDPINDDEADQPVNEDLSDGADSNDQAVDAEEKNDVSGANQPVGAEEGNDVGDKENAINQQPNPNEGLINVSDDVPESNENLDKTQTSDDLSPDQSANDTTPMPSPSGGNVKLTALVSNDCKLGNNNCKIGLEKLDLIPGFKLGTEEQAKFKLWPDARIPYLIDEFSYDNVLRDKIHGWLQSAYILGLQFTELGEPPEDEDKRWVFFVNRRGQLDCKDYSTNSFTNKGVQKVIIGYDCLHHEGPIAAIVMALAGVPPQHNSPDRDEYIRINENHILPNKKGLFKKLNNGDWLFHDLGYDYNSVSHYDAHKYSADGFPTIEFKEDEKQEDDPGNFIIVPLHKDDTWMFKNDAKTYSNTDILKVRMLYNRPGKMAKSQLKPEECNSLFRPGPNFNNVQLKEEIPVKEYPKPEKYIAAVGGNTDDPSPTTTEPDRNDDNKKKDEKLFAIPGKDVEGEQLSSLE